MCVYKSLHNLKGNLEYNRLGVGLALDLFISVLGLIHLMSYVEGQNGPLASNCEIFGPKTLFV